AGLVMSGRSVKGKRLMRTFVVVERPPVIEVELAVMQRLKARRVEQLGLQGSVKPLVFALSLGMIRSPMTDRDTQAQQPDGQTGIGKIGGATPRSTVVHQHPGRQPKLAKQVRDALLDGVGRLIPAGFEPP